MATGPALTLGLDFAIVVGILVYMVRTQSGLVRADRAVERWSDPRMTATAIATLRAVTIIGATLTVVVLAILVAAFAVAVACSRVFLGVHFGWARASLCTIALGGRVMRFRRTRPCAATESEPAPRFADEHAGAELRPSRREEIP